jgi:hypothetical protein
VQVLKSTEIQKNISLRNPSKNVDKGSLCFDIIKLQSAIIKGAAFPTATYSDCN